MTRLRTAITAIVGVLLLASCSIGSGGDDAESDQKRHLKGSLCETGISTSALRKMYPGPYSSTKMLPSTDGKISGVHIGKGKSEGGCDVWITQEKGDVGTTLSVLVRVEPRESVDDLFERYKKSYPAYRSQRLTLGPAKGFTAYNGAQLAFDCRQPKNSTPGVSVQVFLPRHPEGLDVDRPELAEGAARLAADTARYVSSTLLKCSGPRLPDGAPDQKPRAES